MAHALDWSMVRAEELAALAQPHLATNTTTSAEPITLQIGDRRFITTESTLKDGSPYFAAFFSGRWTHTKLDGAYFIDEDGDSFEHILRYLRHKVQPLFWDRINGFDRQKYNALRVSAEFFGVESLSDWIKHERYTSAVTTSTTTSMSTIHTSGSVSEPHDPNTKVSYFRYWATQKRYICPVEPSHDGYPQGCRPECFGYGKSRREGKYVDWGEAPFLYTVTIRERTIFNQGVLKERVRREFGSTLCLTTDCGGCAGCRP